MCRQHTLLCCPPSCVGSYLLPSGPPLGPLRTATGPFLGCFRASPRPMFWTLFRTGRRGRRALHGPVIFARHLPRRLRKGQQLQASSVSAPIRLHESGVCCRDSFGRLRFDLALGRTFGCGLFARWHCEAVLGSVYKTTLTKKKVVEIQACAEQMLIPVLHLRRTKLRPRECPKGCLPPHTRTCGVFVSIPRTTPILVRRRGIHARLRPRP